MTRIAVVGMACRYPDATSPRELWENALAGRRAFRRLPRVRMNLDDYWDPDPTVPDRFYARNAAVIEGYEFDRIAYKVAGSTFRATDLTHWLALDMAALALADAGFPMGEGLPRDRTGVVVGNSLTGEFSRANQLRLRWPFVRRMVAAALKEQDWDDEQLSTFLDGFEATFKSPFPPIDEDSLAGALSNTIAGRICNHFDLRGGGYTVDGACSSSLLSVATACKALGDGDIDVAVAGGVDLSIDPFEIIGFAKTGALATGEMRVYDRGSNGFWPGEGCGMVVLMRESEAKEAGHRIYASVAGWGISSDGKGGMTRPEVGGYRLALRRAYERSGFGIETVGLFEGHGTGTQLGDLTELTALCEARLEADRDARPAAIGSIKAMIGHTKAAAGVAGLIKAAMAIHHQVLPPAVGCPDPHELFCADRSPLRVLRKAEAWPDDVPVRAGVTAMGFGGINTHVVLDSSRPRRPVRLDTRTRALAGSVQDAELLLIDAGSPAELIQRLDRVIEFVPTLAYAQLSDLAATLHRELRELPYRAAVLVSNPEEAEQRLREVREALVAGETTVFSPNGRVLLGHASGQGRVGFLFPGQGSGSGTSGGALRRRFAEVDEVYVAAALPATGDMVATEVAQPRIVTGTLAGLRALSTLGIEATVAVGHSLGEIAALQWAGALDEESLLRVVRLRARTMSAHSASGTMASVAVSPEALWRLAGDLPVVVAGYNGPGQTVIAGTVEAVSEVCDRALDSGQHATLLPVSHAFHSPLVADAASAFAEALIPERFRPIGRRIISTVTGEPLPADADIVELLRRQVTAPVLFSQALAHTAKDIDLLIEVGPGRVLSGLTRTMTDVRCLALDTDDESLVSLLRAVAAAYVVGACAVDASLFDGRLSRPLQVGAEFKFFGSPCELAPPLPVRVATAETAAAGAAVSAPVVPLRAIQAEPVAAVVDPSPRLAESSTDLLRRLAAERAELPLDLVVADSRLLDDLHLSSITVGQLTNQLAGQLGVPAARVPTNFATATVRELADALDALAETAHGNDALDAAMVAGAAPWARAWTIDLDEVPRPARTQPEDNGAWQVYAEADHPLAEPLRIALEGAAVGAGTLICLPPDCPEPALQLALYGARTAVASPPGSRFVLVQQGRGAAGLVKTLRLEAPHLRVSIVDLPAHGPRMAMVEWVVAEVAATTAFVEAHYDAAGARRIPTLRALPIGSSRSEPPLDGTDVLLVTGGGKGITAECAMSVAAATGARLAVLGRSDPAQDEALAANLRRMADAGMTVCYARADITDPDQVRSAVAELTAALGPVTAVLHGAGANEPSALTNLDLDAFRHVLAPKVDGLRAVLAAIEPERLRLLVTLGSIIGRSGLRGEAHYATANEWLAALTDEIGQRYPQCRSICLEWSVWSGVGMGERLSVVESLTREGVVPITPDQGVAVLWRLLADPSVPSVVVISGRTEGIDTVRHEQPELPLLRFVQRPLIRYHGVELVVEVDLNAGTDLYLADHLLDGNLLFPAVFGMEAMAQVAAAATGWDTVPVIEQAEFLRPIVVPPGATTTIRIAAVVTGPDTVAVAIHSAETGFVAEHFRARLRYRDTAVPDGPPVAVSADTPPVPLDPATDLYGDILFQGGRFQRLRRYHRAAAREVDVEVEAVEAHWFAGYLPADLVLGDPGVRDALMHGNQVCVPNATLLPAAIDRVYPAGDRLAATQTLRYCATERAREGDTYIYDIALRSATGEVVERWEGLRLRAVRQNDGRGPWVAPLLGPYLERTIGELLGEPVAVAVEPDPVRADPSGEDDPGRSLGGHVAQRRSRTARAAARALGRPVSVRYRPDGRPEVDGDRAISAAHGVGVTLCVAAAGAVGCDLEQVTARPAASWLGLLGPHAELARLVAVVGDEPEDTAATRVWAAIECMQKAGQSPHGPLVLQPAQRPGWATFRSGRLCIATFATSLRDVEGVTVFAILIEGRR